MAQKIILFEGYAGGDLLACEPLAGLLSSGYEVSSVSGFTSLDNRPMCIALLDTPTKEKVSAPQFSITSAGSLTMSDATVGADIYYTTDGNAPSSTSTKYTDALSLDQTTTVKAIAVKNGMEDSDVVGFTYTLVDSEEP